MQTYTFTSSQPFGGGAAAEMYTGPNSTPTLTEEARGENWGGGVWASVVQL